MHSLDNITTIYRGRRFWHTPIADQAIDRIINHFGDRANVPSELMIEFIKGIQKHGHPDGDPWEVFYEPCFVVKATAIAIVCESEDMPPELKKAFYAGGRFHVNKAALQRDGRAYHSRYGEYFYLTVPEGAIALPSANKLIAV